MGAGDSVNRETFNQEKEMTLGELVKLMRRCQEDTLAILGAGAAGRLAHWQKHESGLAGLVHFIQERLRKDSRQNGRMLELASKLSLERIVIYHCPDLFTQEDIEWATATLAGQ